MPELNAFFNFTSAVFLITGFVFIRRQNIPAHKFCMLSACVTSAFFLAGYLWYHWHHGSTPFPGQGWTRPVYFSILLTHTVLAVVQLPLIFMTLFWAFRGNFLKHRNIARITLPIWLYVSITGVVVYWMLYRTQWG